MSDREKLLEDIEAFLKRTGIGATRFGVEVNGERGLMIRLRGGSDVTLGTAEKIRRYMRENDVARPKKRAQMQPAA